MYLRVLNCKNAEDCLSCEEPKYLLKETCEIFVKMKKI